MHYLDNGRQEGDGGETYQRNLGHILLNTNDLVTKLNDLFEG